MSPELPVVSGRQLIAALGKFGYVAVRQKGSHVHLRNDKDARRTPITVPLHSKIALGTLRRILRDAEVTPEELISVL